MRPIYKILGFWWQAKALSRGPMAWVRQRFRAHAHRYLARALRRLLGP